MEDSPKSLLADDGDYDSDFDSSDDPNEVVFSGELSKNLEEP